MKLSELQRDILECTESNWNI
jgi:hypothetical protein